MIKNILIRVDEVDSDILTLEAAADLAKRFDANVTALFLNLIPMVPEAGEESIQLIAAARIKGDAIEQRVIEALEGVGRAREVRRFDIFADESTDVVIRESRTADVFVTRAADGDGDQRRFIEEVIFQSGRHVILVPRSGWPRHSIKSIAIGWNATREAARAVGEALPYLVAAEAVTIIVVTDSTPSGEIALIGRNLGRHLLSHGVLADVRYAVNKEGNTSNRILVEARKCEADLLVAGAYSHSRTREWLLGGVTREFLRHCPVPLLLAH